MDDLPTCLAVGLQHFLFFGLRFHLFWTSEPDRRSRNERKLYSERRSFAGRELREFLLDSHT